MAACPTCAAAVPADFKFCPSCGEAVAVAPAVPLCVYCHSGIEEPPDRCPACESPYHGDCLEENGGCAVLSCERWTGRMVYAVAGPPRATVSPWPPAAAPPPPPPPSSAAAPEAQAQPAADPEPDAAPARAKADEELAAQNFCHRCGAPALPDMKFCQQCGQKF
jgi:hypothetical protein